MFKEFDRQQDYLLPPSLEELLPPDDLAYVVAQAVDLLDLGSLYKKYSSLGQNAYHPGMMLSLLFYAYARGIFSSRRIAEQVRFDLRFMYLCGMQRPDFRTIADFRKENLVLLKDFFLQIVRLCQEAGLAPLKTLAIDGSKVAASASIKRNLSREQLAERLAADQSEVSQMLSAAEAADQEEEQSGENDPPVSLPFTPEKLRQQLLAAKQVLDANPSQPSVNLTDPDCRVQKGVGAGYNAQIAVDCDSYIIAAADVVADNNDKRQLIPMIGEVEKAPGAAASEKQLITDCGYASAAAFSELEMMPHIDAYVPTQEQVKRQRRPVSEFDKSNFKYDLEKRTCVCPKGHPMRLAHQGVNKSGEAYLHFRGLVCPTCPARERCARKQKYRNLTVLLAAPLIKKMEAKMETERGKQAMKLRRQTVEPVFGILKEHLGFRRFRLRGLDKVKGEFSLLCSAYNLKKLHQSLKGGSLAAALARTALFIQKIPSFPGFIASFWRNLCPWTGNLPRISLFTAKG
jgi:transposase